MTNNFQLTTILRGFRIRDKNNERINLILYSKNYGIYDSTGDYSIFKEFTVEFEIVQCKVQKYEIVEAER